MKAVVRYRSLNYNNIRYFRAGSEDVRLLSYGEKRWPVAGANYLEVEGEIKIPKTKKAKVYTVEIDFSRTRKSKFVEAVEGTLKGIGFTGSAGQAWERLQEGSLKLVKLGLDHDDIERMANADKDALRDLKSIGRRARIVTDVFVAAEASIVDTFGRSQNVEITAGRGPIEVTVGADANQSGQTTVTVGEGATFAYLLADLDWDARLKRRRKKIVDLDTDQQGRAEPR